MIEQSQNNGAAFALARLLQTSCCVGGYVGFVPPTRANAAPFKLSRETMCIRMDRSAILKIHWR